MAYISAFPQSVSVALTVGTDAYTDNDVVGGLLTFNIEDHGGSKGGFISRVKLIDDDDEKAALKLFLFDDLPSTIADDAAFAPTVADLKKLIGTVAIAAGDYTTVNSNAYAIKGDYAGTVMGIDFVANDGKNIYGYLVCNGSTPTYTAATDLTIELQLCTF